MAYCSFAINGSRTEGEYSFASGYHSEANGPSSMASGYYTKASSEHQFTSGKLNIEDKENKYLHIVGNGNFENGTPQYSNAHTLDWDGNAWYQGDVYTGGTSQDDAERLAKISEVVPADWSVNDETDPAYVKNRTHWVEDGVIEIIPEQTFTVNPDMGGAFLTEPLSTSLVEDKTYIIQWNVTEYTSTAQVIQEDGITIGVAIGNVDLANGVGDTGEPFVIIEVAKELVEQSGGIYAQIVPLDESTTFITKVGYEGAIYHTIAQEYLPEYLYGYVDGEEICLPEMTVTIDETEYGYFFNEPFLINLVAEEEYTVIWNGVKYKLVAKDAFNAVALGNLSLTDNSAENTGEPFLIVQNFSEEPTSAGAVAIARDATDKTVTFGVTKDGKTIRKIPEEFLPDNRVITLTADLSTGNFATDTPFNIAWAMTELELQKAIRIDFGSVSVYNNGFSLGINNVEKRSSNAFGDFIVIHAYESCIVGENNYPPSMMEIMWGIDGITKRILQQLPHIDVNPDRNKTLYWNGSVEEWRVNDNHTVSDNGQGWFAGDVYVGGTGQSDGKKLATEEYVNTKTVDTSIRWSTSTGLSGKLSPIDSAASALHSANRLAFAKPAGIAIEYSNDTGATWTEYPTSDTNKVALVSGIGSSYRIGNKTTGITLDDQLRITLDATAM